MILYIYYAKLDYWILAMIEYWVHAMPEYWERSKLECELGSAKPSCDYYAFEKKSLYHW